MNRRILVLSGLTWVTGLCWGANKNGSLEVRPNHDESWSCSLKPLESATLTITVANPPAGYRLRSRTTDITSSLEDYFIWTGSYYVMNAAGTAAVTTVKVRCVWEPIPGEGGGGGAPPPLLYGSATGTAKAQPGVYWNEADTTVIAVGSNVTVNAWKDDSVPAPSGWSAVGPVSLEGTGASVTATGTAPSEEENDAVVTSVCDESGKSDTEVLTVVGVDRLEYWKAKEGEWTAMPEVLYVGLGKNQQFRAIRKPEAAPWPAGKPIWTGASGSGGTAMQTFDSGSTNAEDFKLVTAECGNTVTGKVIVLKVDINKVLSDQFSGADENRLPPIGTYPDKNKPMLMGCSAGTTAKVIVEATADPAAAADHAYVGVRKQGTTTILNSHVINSGGQTPLTWDSSTGDAVYEIVAGGDVDGSTTLDPGEVCVTYTDGVRVFNQGEYSSCASYLSSVLIGGALLRLSTAATLLSWFLGNTGNDTTVSVTDPYLYHPVGVEWAGATGPCSKYNFDNLEEVVRATEFRTNLVSQAVTDHYAEMLTYFSAHPGDTHTFGPWSCAFYSFTFPDPGTYIGTDADMYYAFAQVNGFTVTSYQLTMHDSGGLKYDVLSITAAGYFYDLYDFDINAGTGFSGPAAKVQAGYPTLGTSGRVFKDDRVNFNGTWTSP